MKQISTHIFTFLLIVTTIQLSAQSLEFIVQQQLNATANEFNLSVQDISEWTITDQHISPNSGIQHIYIRQQYQGLEIVGANAGLHLSAQDKTKGALSFHNQFISNAALNINLANATTEPTVSATEAVKMAAEQLGYRITAPLVILKTFDENGQNLLLSTGGISLETIPAKLVYQADQNGALKLAWDISILELNHINWWSIRIDATTGQIIDKNNWMLTCNFGTPDACNDFDQSDIAHEHIAKLAPISKAANMVMDAAYNVYAVPVESPIHPGGRTVVNDPSDATASPYGWHDTNGVAGAEYTITRGNNVHAQEDVNGNNGTGYSPDGGAALNFNFPIDLNQAPSNNQNANITNLFYWNNIIHDVSYQLGFNEASGNFQANNYGNGGAANDYVFADAQDGGGANNANFATPPDGSNPRMQMFLWTAPNPDRDGDLDNGIILHEYGHGISIRLTGGAATSGCLSNTEQMGEGWSDYWGVMLTMRVTDQGSDRRSVGTYALNQPTSGDGIREFPYSTDMGINSHTYDRIKTASVPHGIGSVWCAMLWEMTWELIDRYGFDPDFYQGTGGNNIAMNLVMEGLKLQPCSPGFVDGRDAILLADENLYGGANSCLIWRAFAKRGLGYSASQGLSNSRTDGTQAFDLPPGLDSSCPSASFLISISPSSQAACSGQNFVYGVTVTAPSDYNGTVNLSATSVPSGATSSLAANTFNTFPATTTWIISNTAGLAAGPYGIALSGTDGSNTYQKTATLSISAVASAPALTAPANNSTVASLTQTLSWSAVNGANNYDLQMATEAAFTNIIINQTLASTSYPTGVLSPGTTYYWRVRSNSCTTSTYNVYSFTTTSACGQQFTDSGGPNANHTDNELIEWIFCPDNAGQAIRVTFTSFSLETRGTSDCYDDLTVYNGNSTSAPSLGAFCGTMVEDAPGGGVVTATNPSGCLTFVFDSDGSVTRPGWIANITCLGCAEPIVSNVDLSPENCTGSNDGVITVTANAVNPVEYILTPNGGSPINNTTGIFSDLAAGNYSVVLRTIADTDCASAPFAITLTSTTPSISNISTTDGSCENINDGSITIIASTTLGLDYLLTPVSGSPIINTTGIFANLAAGNYTAAVRKTGNVSCISGTSPVTLNTTITAPPTTENFEMCLRESLGTTDGLKANCSTAICNAVTIHPNTTINAATPTICETITVERVTGTVSEIYLSMQVQHQYVGDISATLESPDGTIITLFDRPGRPDNSTFGCSQDNLKLVFADTATLTAADLENTCRPSSGTGVYAIEGAFKAVNLFAAFNGETANGDWKICIIDNYVSADHGALETVTLIVNPARATTTWWDAATDGNLLFTGETFDPIEDGSIDPEKANTYPFWAQCECANCPSQRTLANFVINGRFYFEDNDQDGFGDATNEIVVCEGETPLANHVTNFTDCNDNNNNDVMMTINNQPIASGIHQANAMISSEGAVASNSSLVTFQAGREIILKPGFYVPAGSSFLAKIDSCGQHPADTFQEDIPIPTTRQATKNVKNLKNLITPAALKIFPNPFKMQTTITFDLQQSEKITLVVYDSFGRLVKVFYQQQWTESGSYQVTFESTNLSPGLFIAVLATEHSVVTQRIVLAQ